MARTGGPGKAGGKLVVLKGQAGRAGVVWLVGAGPGDPELLTVKALRLIQTADVVVHDRLTPQPILDLVGHDARLIDVGKRKSRHTLPQEGINSLLVGLAREGLTVVRLKGGDPFMFGRGGEELEALRAEGIEAHVVPGVTAALAAAAGAGAPLTHRGLAQAVTFVTGHAALGGVGALMHGGARLRQSRDLADDQKRGPIQALDRFGQVDQAGHDPPLVGPAGVLDHADRGRRRAAGGDQPFGDPAGGRKAHVDRHRMVGPGQ